MKLGMAIQELHRAENSLAGQLLKVADRHKTDHEVWYVGSDLALWSQEHARQLAEVGERHGLRLSDEPRQDSGLMAAVRGKGSELVGRKPQPALLLLADLRGLHKQTAGVSADWELVDQAAQAAKDAELHELAQRCHPRTLRQMRWTNSMVKIIGAQAMMT